MIFWVFAATELRPDILFIQLFFKQNPGNNVKTKTYKKIFKILIL